MYFVGGAQTSHAIFVVFSQQLEEGDVSEKIYDGTLYIFRAAVKPVQAVVSKLVDDEVEMPTKEIAG